MGAERSEARPGATSRTAQAKATARTQRSPFPAAVCGHRSAKRKEGRPPVGFPGTHLHVSTASRGHRRHACRVPAPTPPSARSPGPTSEATAGSHAAPSEFTARRCRPPALGGPAAPRTHGVQAQAVRLQRRRPAAGVLLPRQVRPRLPAALAAQAPAAEVGGRLRLVGAASATQAPGSEGARALG